MKIKTVLRVLCVASVAVVALMNVALQPAAKSHATAELSSDFLVQSGMAKATAKSANVLNDWQFTRSRPPKCPLF